MSCGRKPHVENLPCGAAFVLDGTELWLILIDLALASWMSGRLQSSSMGRSSAGGDRSGISSFSFCVYIFSFSFLAPPSLLDALDLNPSTPSAPSLTPRQDLSMLMSSTSQKSDIRYCRQLSQLPIVRPHAFIASPRSTSSPLPP